MIAVVTEKDDRSPDLFLETPSGENLGDQISLGKKSARLLAETNNRAIHGASYLGGRFRAAKHSLLQNRRSDQYSRASNKIIPKVPDASCSEQNEHQGLRHECGEEDRRSANPTNKERRQKETKDTAVENGPQNIACFDEILDQAGKRSHPDSNQAPPRCQHLRRDDIMMVAGIRTNQRAIKVDGRGGAESIQRCRRC